jgi:NitT/TauT family transport system ATP-binding protein
VSDPAVQTSDHIIRIEHLDFAYSSGPLIVEDFDLTIQDQEFLTIVGASGCGKSTLLNIIAGLLPPSGGKVYLKEKEITRPGPDRAMVFQDDAVFPWYTVRDNVEYGLKIQKLPASERKQLVNHYLELVGLMEAQNLYPRQLSGGMRKRVDVARAVATNPEVLLMDEPFAALDVLTKERLQAEFLNIWNDNRMTVIFVTHDLEEALYMSDRVVVMGSQPGRVQRVVLVPFSRPRDTDLKTTVEFQDMRRELGHVLTGRQN